MKLNLTPKKNSNFSSCFKDALLCIPLSRLYRGSAFIYRYHWR